MNSEIFEQLLKEKMKMIYRYLLCLGARRQDAEDVVQETLYKTILYLDSIDPQKISAWMFRVALNHYYDLCRKQEKWYRKEVDFMHVLVEEWDLPEMQALRQEQASEVREALNQLKPVYKQLLLLKYQMELSYEEIASLLDIPLSTLKTYLFRARKQFANLYRGEADV